tara:strand:- start:578 stop:898 length:321 start_codon:yes stop_codon:yes gene_type:complete
MPAGYAAYREKLSTIEGPSIPIVAVTLSDLTHAMDSSWKTKELSMNEFEELSNEINAAMADSVRKARRNRRSRPASELSASGKLIRLRDDVEQELVIFAHAGRKHL